MEKSFYLPGLISRNLILFFFLYLVTCQLVQFTALYYWRTLRSQCSVPSAHFYILSSFVLCSIGRSPWVYWGPDLFFFLSLFIFWPEILFFFMWSLDTINEAFVCLVAFIVTAIREKVTQVRHHQMWESAWENMLRRKCQKIMIWRAAFLFSKISGTENGNDKQRLVIKWKLVVYLNVTTDISGWHRAIRCWM